MTCFNLFWVSLGLALGHFNLLWVVFGQFSSPSVSFLFFYGCFNHLFWVILACFESFWLILDKFRFPFGSVLLVLTHFVLFWVSLGLLFGCLL